MPNISKCRNGECPSKNKCYRFTSVHTPITQTYSRFTFGKNGRCTDYWPLGNKEGVKH